LPLLEGRGLSKHFGGVQALREVTFAVEPQTIVGLIGPNGAGKTTLFNAIAGVFKPSAGKVIFDQTDITGLPANQTCRRGISRTFQVTRPFGDLTCLENVMVAAVNRHPRLSTSRIQDLSMERLEVVEMSDLAQVHAGNLNLIQKKRLEIARALATEPKLLMLDEVLGGLNTQEIARAVEFIRSLKSRFGLTVFWIEHVMGAIMSAADRVIVLDQGQVLMEGTPERVVNDSRVIQAYLGE
jgi:branched-chain amino acid transport system ATP-binding protein